MQTNSLPSRTSTKRPQAEGVGVQKAPLVRNRIRAVMAHTTRYAFKSEARLAHDAGVSKSALNRLVNGLTTPSYRVVCALTQALEQKLGRRIDPRDLVAVGGRYPTAFVSEICGCRGCVICRETDALNLTENEDQTP